MIDVTEAPPRDALIRYLGISDRFQAAGQLPLL